MALQNGAIEGVVLLVPAAGTAGARLRLGSAYRWAAIRNEVHALYGWWPEVTSAGDGYRDKARQELLFKRNYTTTNTGVSGPKMWDGSLWWRRTASTPPAAVPGTSNHGLGTTVDVANIGALRRFDHPRYLQFAPVAQRHGFSNAEGRSIGEPWHWSDTKDPDSIDGTAPPTSTPEADMPLNQADLEAIDRLIVGRVTAVVDQLLTQHAAQHAADPDKPVLTQTDKEAVDKLIIDRLAQGLGPLSQAVGSLQAGGGGATPTTGSGTFTVRFGQ